MPGYDTERFVDTKDLEEYLCGICHGVLDKPLISICCGQSYCSGCINQWLTQSGTCPTDRRPLRSQDLIQAPKNFQNLMSKLKVRCDFKGCRQVMPFGDLPVHYRQCRYNPDNFCQNCDVPKDVEHNCYHILRARIESLTNELKRIKAENSTLREKIRIQSDANDRRVTVLKSEMAKPIERKAIDISKEALDKYRGERVEMARHIAWELDKQFGTGWNCFVAHGSNWGSLVKAYRNNYLQFRLGSNEIVIFETKNESLLKLFLIVVISAFTVIFFRSR